MKKKICILQNGLARGGTDTFVLNLCRGLDKQLFDVTVVNPSNKPGSQVLEPDILDTGAHIVHTYPLGGVKSQLKHLVLLYKLLRKEKFDVFQTNIDLYNGPNLFVAWLARVPVRCCHSHNTMQQKEVVEGKTLFVAIYQRFMRWMCWHFSNRRCGCSEDAMNFLFKGHNWRQTEYPSVIYNGIDLHAFGDNQIDKNQNKKEIGLSAKRNIITIGQIIPQKNPMFIVDIFKEICLRCKDVDLVWVGVGYMSDEVKSRISQYGLSSRTHFLGRRDDVPRLLKACDLFLLPSVFEGLGIVLIEAQASRLPCVASDTVPKLADCGAVEFLPLSKQASFWAERIIQILDGNHTLFVDKEKLDNFSIDNMVKQMQIVFEKIE